MERFKAYYVNNEIIILKNTADIEKLHGIIENEENFILEWNESTVIDSVRKLDNMSQLMIGNNLKSKIKNGDVVLSAREPQGGK